MLNAHVPEPFRSILNQVAGGDSICPCCLKPRCDCILTLVFRGGMREMCETHGTMSDPLPDEPPRCLLCDRPRRDVEDAELCVTHQAELNRLTDDAMYSRRQAKRAAYDAFCARLQAAREAAPCAR